MNDIVCVKNLVKAFKKTPALNGVTFSIPKSSVFGLIGPNGAGKTTTMNILTNIYEPTSGEVEIFGLNYIENPIEIKKRIGVMPEGLALFENLRGAEQILLVGKLYGLDQKTIESRSRELFDILELKDAQFQFIREYSTGMKKKLALACTFIHTPEILFLDEPFEGIDPISAQIIRENLQLMVKRGATVFLTSHNLEMVEKLCTEVAIINQGMIVFHSPIKTIRSELESKLDSRTYSILEDILLQVVDRSKRAAPLSWLIEDESIS